MSTTIDSLQIEISSNSQNAANNITALATALGNLKKNGTVRTAVKNLNDLSAALKNFTVSTNATQSIGKVANALSKLKGIGSTASIATGITKLQESLRALENLNTDNATTKIAAIATAVAPLSNIKAGGLNSMANGLVKLTQVVDKLDDQAVNDLVASMSDLDKKLGDAAPNIIAVGQALKAMKVAVQQNNVAIGQAKINIKNFNLSNLTNAFSNLKSVIDKVVDGFNKLVDAASEWDGISARFGRGFGEQAQEVYSWAQKLNDEMHINIQQFMQYSSIYATMLKGYGVESADAAKMALGYTELTYDIWAGYNDIYKSYADAADAVKSAIAGEVEPIRKAGFTIVEATLKQTAANHGLDVSISKLTESQKSYLRYLTLVDQAHSQNIIGTYAKEMNTAEGVMRTFAQQIKSISQAFGSLFLPILINVMPYVQAFIEMLEAAIQRVALLFGVTIQGVDWSDYNESVGGAVEGTEDLAEAVEDVKNASIGIDELNVISPSTDKNSASGNSSTAGFDGLDVDSLWDESIFNGINDQVDALKDKIKNLLSPLEKIGSYLWDYKDTILTLGITIAGLKLTAKITSAWKKIKKLKIVKTALSAFKDLRTNGASVFGALKGSVSEFTSKLTGIQKASIVAVAGVLEFMAIKDSVKSLALGCEDVGAKIATIGVAAGAAATAMYIALGPAGLAVAAVVGLAGAVMGLYQANQDIIAQYVNISVFDDYGYAIGNLTGLLRTAWDETQSLNNNINALGDSVVENDEKISNAQSGISAYRNIISTTGQLTTEQTKTMSQNINDLATAIRDNLGYNVDIVFSAFSKVSQNTAKQLGLDVAEMTNILNTFKNTFSEKTTELENVAQGYLTRLANGEILDDTERAEFEDTLDYLNEMSGQTYTNNQKLKLAMSELQDLDFGDIETAQAAISEIATLGETMFTDTKTAYGNATTAIDTLIAQATTMNLRGDLTDAALSQFKGVMEDYRTGITQSYEEEKEKISADLNSVFGYIREQINKASSESIVGADSWDSLSWWRKLLYGNNEKMYRQDIISSVQKNFSEPLNSAIDSVEKTLSVKGYTTGTATIDRLFEGVNDGATNTKIKNAKETMKKVGLDTIQGYVDGIENNLGDVEKTGIAMANTAIGAVKETQDSNSPAKEYIKLAKDAVDGYKKGVTDNIDSIETVWKDGLKKIAKKITTVIEETTDDFKSIFKKSTWEGYAKNVTDALANIKMPEFDDITLTVSYKTKWLSNEQEQIIKALGLKGWPTLKFAATGGIFDKGSLVWAGERGPEIVANAGGGRTGVMNVQQMADAMYESVYAAMMAAMQANDKDGTQAVNVYLDSKQITSAVEKRQKERGATIMGSQVYSY